MKLAIYLIAAILVSLSLFCTHEKYPMPSIPEDGGGYTYGVGRYVQINPPLDAAHGYDFKRPADIYFGADKFLYVADTENNRIVMMDEGGAIQGISQYIPHPEAISQNDSLQLLIVNKSNVVYGIDLFKYNHEIGNAPIDTVFHQQSEPSRQFTGITVHNRLEYFVTVIDTADSSTNFQEFSFIYDFNYDSTLKGPLPLNVNGTGLYSAIVPTGIVSLREQYLDISSRETTPEFIFCQSGNTSLIRNNFKVQSVTTFTSEGRTFLTPNTSLIGTDIYNGNKYYFPEDVAIDRSGFVFVVDKGAYTIDDSTGISIPDTTKPAPGFYRFGPSGNQLQAVLGAGPGESQFNSPKGIAVLPSTEEQIVYIADTGNNRILMFKLSTQF